MTDITRIIEEIKATPHFRNVACPECGQQCRIHALQIDSRCSGCGTRTKCRAFGAIGTELLDVIDAVLDWAGEGESFDAVMRRRQEIISAGDEG